MQTASTASTRSAQRAKAPPVPEAAVREDPASAARRKAERARVKALQQPDAGLRHGVDLGPGIAIGRGVVEVNEKALVPLDPDSRRSPAQNMPRAQRVWAPDRALRAGSIDQRQHDAAARFLRDYEVGELGANPGRRLYLGSAESSPPWARMPYQEARAQARESYLRACGAMMMGFAHDEDGAGQQSFLPILLFCVLQRTPNASVPPTASEFADRVGWRTAQATMWLKAALAALAAHYGIRPPRPAPADAPAPAAREAKKAVARAARREGGAKRSGRPTG